MTDDQYWQQMANAMRAQEAPTCVALVVESLQDKRFQFKQLQRGLRDLITQVQLAGIFSSK